MSTINVFQISLELWGIVLSFLLAVFSGTSACRAGGAIKKVWTMLLVNCLLLSCDALAYIYRGDTSDIGMIITRVSNFGVFLIQGILMWMFTSVIQNLITRERKVSLRSVPMAVVSVCVGVQLLGTAVTPFTGLYYTFNEMNRYVRGKGVFLSFFLLGIVLAVDIVEIWRNKHKLSENLWNTFFILGMIAVLVILAQFLFYGLSFINVAITLILIVLFMNLLIDNRNQEFQRHIAGLEAVINELTTDADGRE